MNPRATWRKSSRSPQNANCVEVGAVWRQSSRSSSAANCVEVAGLGDQIAVRDSKVPDGPVLLFGPSEWVSFVAAAREGRYDPA